MHRLAIRIHDRGGILDEECPDVFEFHFFLAKVANPKDELDLLAVAVDPLRAKGIAQARLQSADFLTPGGEGFFFGVNFQLQLPGGVAHLPGGC